MIYRSVRPPSWTEVWIVGGGPSADGFAFARAYGHAVLCVNDAISRVPSWVGAHLGIPARERYVLSFCSIDPSWIKSHRNFLAAFQRERFLAAALDTHPECGGIDGATYLTRGHDFGLSEDPSIVNTGGNSGYAAINVAFLKGATKIHLVGFDMNDGSDKYMQWAPRFRTMLPQLERRGVQVINENPASAIDAFEKEVA